MGIHSYLRSSWTGDDEAASLAPPVLCCSGMLRIVFDQFHSCVCIDYSEDFVNLPSRYCASLKSLEALSPVKKLRVFSHLASQYSCPSRLNLEASITSKQLEMALFHSGMGMELSLEL